MTELHTELSADIVLVKYNNTLIRNRIYSLDLVNLALERVNNTEVEYCSITVQELNKYYEALALTR